MAAGNDLEVAVAECEAIGIVENLDVVPVALGEVDGVFVLPVVVVLVKGNGAYAARGEVEGGVAEVVVGADGGLQQRDDKGIVDEAVAARAAVVPRADEVGLGRGGFLVQDVEVVAHRVEAEDFVGQAAPCLVFEYVRVEDVAVLVEGVQVGCGGCLAAK